MGIYSFVGLSSGARSLETDRYKSEDIENH